MMVVVAGTVARFGELEDALRAAGSRKVWAHPATIQAIQAAAGGVRSVAMNTARQRAATEALADVLRSGSLTVAGVSDGEWEGVRTAPADGGHTVSARASVADVAGVKALSWAVLAVQQQTRTGFGVFVA